MDDIEAFVQLASSRMNANQLTALITALARQASAWPGYMADLQARGGHVKGDWRSPVWDQDLVLSLRRIAGEIEERWAADEDHRERWNSYLERFCRGHDGFLYELGPAPGGGGDA